MASNDENAPLRQSSGGSYQRDSVVKPQTVDKAAMDIADYSGDNYKKQRSMFAVLAFSVQIILIILYAVAVEYDSPLSNPADENVSNYVYFQQINVMMFIGFGYLMTFLRRYAYGAISLNMLLTVLCIQWGMFMFGLVDVLFTHEAHKLRLGVDNLAQGDIAAAVILISFGAVLGRATPSQLLMMGVIEIVMYSINAYIVTEILHVTDVGGSIIIHTFGCYFGLAVSKVLGPPLNEDDNQSEYRSDLFSMVGTIFLWLYWPSFNGVFPNADITDASVFGFSQSRAFLNTVLSLSSCTIATFAMSTFLEAGDLDMVHIQNSTLAGGVAVGAAANLYLTPAGSMAVGLCAAVLSVAGFHFITPWIQRTFGVWDTCGINNLHGMPGILGGIVSAIAIGAATTSNYPPPEVSFYYDTFGAQAGYQIAGVVVTVAMAAVSGVITGHILTKLPFNAVQDPYKDREFFMMPQILDPFASNEKED